MIRVTSKGSFNSTMTWLTKLLNDEQFSALVKYGPIGVNALSSATPKESGETAGAWDFEIDNSPGKFSIHWTNSHVNKGENVAILLQYGHGVRGGGYVEGRDYINPAMRPVFDQMVEDMWKVVTG